MKFKKIKLTLIIFFLTMNISYAQGVSPFVSDFEKIKNNITIDTYNTEDTYTLVKQLYENLSDYAKEKISMYNIKITNKEVRECEGYESLSKYTLGVIRHNSKTIIIHDSKYDDESTRRIFYHELGHSIDFNDCIDKSYVDGKETLFSDSNEFKELFKEEGEDLKKHLIENEEYFYNQTKESFAESFSIFMDRPDYFRIYAPKLYNYFYKIYNAEIKKGLIYDSKGNTYYLNSNNELAKGWVKDSQSNKKYHFNNNGIMDKATVIDGIIIAPDGEALDYNY